MWDYRLVDHAGKIALDGSKMMKLSELIGFFPKQQRKASPLDIYRDLFTAEISLNLSRLNVGIGQGQNREWEVGHKSRYDDLDTKMSGTRMSV